MDPLGIAASAASLVITTSKVSIWLYEVLNAIQNIDIRISTLSNMVVRLLGLVSAVEKTIRDCQSSRLVMAHIDDDMWVQIEVAVLDCVTTLDGLDRLVTDIKAAGSKKNIFRKLKLEFSISMHVEDLAEFNTRIQISNDALQISLQVLNISLSFRNHETADAIYRELQSLRELFECVFRSSQSTEGRSNQCHYRLSRNLQKLAQRARKFHSNASTTASTVFESGQGTRWDRQTPYHPRPASTVYGPGPSSATFSPSEIGGWSHQHHRNSSSFPGANPTFAYGGRPSAPRGLQPGQYWNGANAGPAHVMHPQVTTATGAWIGGSDGGASAFGGSVVGALSEERKERIHQWRAQAQPRPSAYERYPQSPVPLNTVDETQETTTTDDTTTNLSTSMDDDLDRTTNMTSPDLASPRVVTPSKEKESERPGSDFAKHDGGMKEEAEREGPNDKNGDDDDGDDESDRFGEEYMADILLNCEELAAEKFHEEEYARAEEFLRMAIESSTGNSSSTADFKVLKMRLAICCCLQGKWDVAYSSVDALTKSKGPSNTPVFDILHAISIAYLQKSQFTEAYDICKIALQGRKRISGKGSDAYHESLGLLSVICDKKGNSLEAEAVKHSLAKTSTLDLRALAKSCDTEQHSSAKEYILQHRTLIPSIFASQSPLENPTDSSREEHKTRRSPQPDQVPAIPYLNSTGQSGQQRALRDEKSGKEVSDFDTGKIVVTDTDSQKQPVIVHPVPATSQDEYSGQNWAQFDTGKQFYIPPSPTLGRDGDFSDRGQALAFNLLNNAWRSAKFYPDSIVPFWPVQAKCKADSLAPVVPPAAPSPAARDPEWYSDLEVFPPSPVAVKGLGPVGRLRPLSPITRPPAPAPPPTPANVSRASHALPIPTSQPPLIPARSSPRLGLPTSPRTFRWMVGSSGGKGGIAEPIVNISAVGTRPSLELRKVISIDITVSGAMAAISFGSGAAVYVNCGHNVQSSIGAVPDVEVTTPRSPNISSPTASDIVPLTENPSTLLKAVSKFLGSVESSLVDTISAKGASDPLADQTWEQVVVSFPDILMHRAKLELWGVLSQVPLFAQARVIPRSLAVATGFIFSDSKVHNGVLSSASSYGSQVLVVLNCDDVFVEASRLIIYAPEGSDSPTFLAPAPTGALPKAENCGLVNASLQFSHLARQKIHKVVSQYKLKIRSSALESISEACCTKFREHILPNFFPEGNTAWNIQVELPPNFPGLENGFLQFTEDEIEGCFKSSVETIIKTALFCVLESYDENRPVAHFIAAGTYASSPYLQRELRSALEGLLEHEPSFIPGKEGRPSAAVAGGLLFAAAF